MNNVFIQIMILKFYGKINLLKKIQKAALIEEITNIR